MQDRRRLEDVAPLMPLDGVTVLTIKVIERIYAVDLSLLTLNFRAQAPVRLTGTHVSSKQTEFVLLLI